MEVYNEAFYDLLATSPAKLKLEELKYVRPNLGLRPAPQSPAIASVPALHGGCHVVAYGIWGPTDRLTNQQAKRLYAAIGRGVRALALAELS